ncbi:hypothetical protein PIB30_000760 [Stylosanthes scabra]|uniref:UBX domain-containing protein n=1 Tax=Stylosanthes scabra TaxID=79078 RepID=A0ABU6Q3D3_9FABA|nr:hypothetical protein [Stylosanthes scabra]
MSSPATRDHRIVRRVANLPRSIMGGISRAMGDGMGLVGIGRRRSHHHNHNHNANVVQVQVQHHGPPLLPQEHISVPEEWAFLESFEQQYGNNHPFFYACRFREALKLAEQDHKFVFMYLHSPDHNFANVFCKETLCSELVTQFLDMNFVCWGALADRGEGMQMVAMLRPATFPCCAVIAPAPGDSMTVLQQIEGPLSAAELVEILQRTMEEQGLAFGSGKAKQEAKIIADRRLREEQDAAYFAALQIDKEKEKHKNSPLRGGIHKPVEARNGRNFGKLSKNSVSVSKQNSKNEANESNSQKQTKGTASRVNGSEATQILIRFPNGERREQSFVSTDKIQSIFTYINSLGIPGIQNYRLISNFPRRAYGVDQMRMSLKEAGLFPKASLFLEPM